MFSPLLWIPILSNSVPFSSLFSFYQPPNTHRLMSSGREAMVRDPQECAAGGDSPPLAVTALLRPLPLFSLESQKFLYPRPLGSRVNHNKAKQRSSRGLSPQQAAMFKLTSHNVIKGRPALLIFQISLLIFRGGGRERSICCSAYLCIHWLILGCALTGD